MKTLTENSSLPGFIKKSINLKSPWTKVRVVLIFVKPIHFSLHLFVFVSLSTVSDDTNKINQVISSNLPESCYSYLMELEKKGNPHLDYSLLTKLIDFYTKVFSNMPLGKHCQNENYAKMLVRFAELKA